MPGENKRVKIGTFMPNVLGQKIPKGMPLGVDEVFVNFQARAAKNNIIFKKFGVIAME